MPELQRLRLDHAPALLAFEQENRAYFAASVPDRGDDYFARFDARHSALLAEQATGACHFHLLVDSGGEVLGRINLVDVADGSAELGFRIAEKAAGRGLATAAVQQVCALSVEYGLTALRASATFGNAGSHAVLTRTGFVPTGDVMLDGRPGRSYLRGLSDERVDPPLLAGERETLRAYLDYHRATLAMKCQGLSDEDLRRQSMPPSTLSLLALVRHMAEVERAWFRRVINGEDIPLVWSDQNDYQVAYDASASTRSEAFGAWQTEVRHARRIEEQAESLDVTGHQVRWGKDVSLRLVMLHLIHEYARHNGHADFLREGIDGTVGA